MIVRGFPDLIIIFISCINIMLMYIFMIVHWMLAVIGWIAVAVVRVAVAGLMMVVCMFVVSSWICLFVILKTKTCFLVVLRIIKNTFSNLKPSEENKKNTNSFRKKEGITVITERHLKIGLIIALLVTLL